jgi:4-amino-4-deoxy-L-arabinose transferase-like glycosyltransferase
MNSSSHAAPAPLPGSEPFALGRHETWRVAVLLLAWLACTAALRPLMLPDEGRYVGVAWEMLRSGDWLTPTLDGLPFFHKPPLFYWITAAAMRFFGPVEWAARAAPLLGAWAGGMALYLFLRRWAGAAQARTALAVLAAMPLFFVGAQFANLDMLVAGCICATVLCAAHAVLGAAAGEPQRWAVLAAWVLAAAGVLAKGLIGLVIPALVLLPWLLLGGLRRQLPRLLWWPAPLLFAALALPWFVLAQRQHPGFFDYFFVVQHFKRFAAGGFNNVQPFWFYPVVLALCSAPFVPALVRALRQPLRPQPVRLLMLLWALAVVVFFSLPRSKLLGYVLPALPPLAALVAEGLPLAAQPWRRAGWTFGMPIVVGWALVLSLAAWPLHSHRDLAAALAAQHRPGEPVVALAPYPYDLPFYARLTEPVVVVQPWDQAPTTAHDDWRKELGDAAGFAPAVAAHTLLTPQDLPALLCQHAVSWVITDAAPAPRPALLAGATPVYGDHDGILWQLRRDTPASADRRCVNR